MSKVIQIRDVPDDVHDALAQAAQAQGLSLTRHLLRELEHLAMRAQVVRDNAVVIRRTQARVQRRPDRDPILSVLHRVAAIADHGRSAGQRLRPQVPHRTAMRPSQ